MVRVRPGFVFGIAFLLLGGLRAFADGTVPQIDYNGIINGNCGGFLVRLPGAQDLDPVLMFTAGHCAGTMGTNEPQTGAEIAIPTPESLIGLSRCKVERIIPEDHLARDANSETTWLYNDIIVFNGCDGVGPGTSGLPLIDTRNGQVVGLVSGGIQQADESIKPFAGQTRWALDCFDSRGRLDLTLSACALPRPETP